MVVKSTREGARSGLTATIRDFPPERSLDWIADLNFIWRNANSCLLHAQTSKPWYGWRRSMLCSGLAYGVGSRLRWRSLVISLRFGDRFCMLLGSNKPKAF